MCDDSIFKVELRSYMLAFSQFFWFSVSLILCLYSVFWSIVLHGSTELSTCTHVYTLCDHKTALFCSLSVKPVQPPLSLSGVSGCRREETTQKWIQKHFLAPEQDHLVALDISPWLWSDHATGAATRIQTVAGAGLRLHHRHSFTA